MGAISDGTHFKLNRVSCHAALAAGPFLHRCGSLNKLPSDLCGQMAEWLKAHAWKACIPQGIQGSNPCLSAITP
jgi:hypothetical protein